MSNCEIIIYVAISHSIRINFGVPIEYPVNPGSFNHHVRIQLQRSQACSRVCREKGISCASREQNDESLLEVVLSNMRVVVFQYSAYREGA